MTFVAEMKSSSRRKAQLRRLGREDRISASGDIAAIDLYLRADGLVGHFFGPFYTLHSLVLHPTRETPETDGRLVEVNHRFGRSSSLALPSPSLSLSLSLSLFRSVSLDLGAG